MMVRTAASTSARLGFPDSVCEVLARSSACTFRLIGVPFQNSLQALDAPSAERFLRSALPTADRPCLAGQRPDAPSIRASPVIACRQCRHIEDHLMQPLTRRNILQAGAAL